MPACKGKLSNGQACTKTVNEDRIYCRWHDPLDESWREVYERLELATPEEKTIIVLGLIKAHPDHRLVLPQRDGQVADLRRVNLRSTNLWNANLQSADLRGANLERAHLRNANLQGAQLQFANLQSANLKGSHLEGASLRHANLQSAQLWLANLERAHLRNANLQGARLRLANLQDTNLQGANFSRASLDRTDLQKAHLEEAILYEADLREARLQDVNLSIVKNMSNIYLSGAWLDRTRMRREQLSDSIREEQERDYVAAKRGYLALKKNFDDLGDYDASSWAYRKERRMEKLEAWQGANYFKFFGDTFVEWLCDYGESVWRVIGWMAALLFVIGPLMFSVMGGFVWSEELAHDFFALSSPWNKFWFSYPLYLLYTLDALTTASFSGLRPANDAVKFASGFFAIAGIVLAGLLGFVAGNRIRRS